MLVIEALGALQFLKKELISLSDLAQVLGIGKAAMSARVQRKITLRDEEISKLNNYYDVNLLEFSKNNKAKENTASEEMNTWFRKMFEEEMKKKGFVK